MPSPLLTTDHSLYHPCIPPHCHRGAPSPLQKACEAALKTIKNLGEVVDILFRRGEKLK